MFMYVGILNIFFHDSISFYYKPFNLQAMKRITLLFTLTLLALSTVSFAKKITIKVSNFQFSPSSVNAKVGDTIIFKWVNGTHTTTSSTIPANAKVWDKPIDVSH